MKIRLTILMFLIECFNQHLNAQSYLINPNGDGGFETGITYSANGWTVVNSTPLQTNQWHCGTAATGYWGARCAHIGTDPSNNSYNINVQSTVHFYRDIVFPAGISNIVLSFNWKGFAEFVFDYLQVFIVPTTTTPIAAVMLPGNKAISGKLSQQTNWQSASYTLSNSLAGTTQRLVFSWRNDQNIGTAPAGAIDNISLTPGIPLPVSLISFIATSETKENAVNCKWTTASEINNNFFTLEKSADAKTFKAIAHLKAMTANSSYHNYEFTDEHPYNGISYYRLSQTDLNGTTEILKTVTVNFKNKNSFGVQCYPSVGNGEINVDANKSLTEIKVFDVNGNLVKDISQSSQFIYFNLSDLKKGIYFIQCICNEETDSQKIIIQ